MSTNDPLDITSDRLSLLDDREVKIVKVMARQSDSRPVLVVEIIGDLGGGSQAEIEKAMYRLHSAGYIRVLGHDQNRGGTVWAPNDRTVFAARLLEKMQAKAAVQDFVAIQIQRWKSHPRWAKVIFWTIVAAFALTVISNAVATSSIALRTGTRRRLRAND